MASISRSGAFAWVSLMLFASSATVNVLQAQRIRTLLDGDARASLVGRSAVVLRGVSLQGEARTLTFRGGLPTVLYFFSPTCLWCERNWANIEALAAGAAGRFRVVAVSRATGLSAYITKRHLTLDVIEGLGENEVREFGLSGTPHTVVVSSDGQITHEWSGAYSPRVERQIETVFNVLLPGVAPIQAGPRLP